MSGLGPTVLATPVVVVLLVGLFLVERALQRRDRRAAVMAMVELRQPARRRRPATPMASTTLALVPAAEPARRSPTTGAAATWRTPAA